jgi:hypothetical protein
MVTVVRGRGFRGVKEGQGRLGTIEGVGGGCGDRGRIEGGWGEAEAGRPGSGERQLWAVA